MKALTILILSSCLAVFAAAGEPKKIIFVCEHGSVKSVVAVAHFNRMATEAGLDYRAISRGTKPDQEVPAAVIAGLKQDGLAPSLLQPVKLDAIEARAAQRIVAMCELPGEFAEDQRVAKWTDVPPVTVDYAKARDVLVGHLRELIADLQKHVAPARRGYSSGASRRAISSPMMGMSRRSWRGSGMGFDCAKTSRIQAARSRASGAE